MTHEHEEQVEQDEPVVLLEKAKLLRADSASLLGRIDALLANGFPGQADIPAGKKLPKKKRAEPLNGLTKFRNLVLSEDRFLGKERGVTDIYKNFRLPQYRQPIRVDIIADGGRRWVKVKASAMTGVANDLIDDSEPEDDDSDYEDSESGGEPGDDGSSMLVLPLIKQAKALLVAAKENPIHYETPTIVMKFLSDVDDKLARMLNALGVEVETNCQDQVTGGEGHDNGKSQLAANEIKSDNPLRQPASSIPLSDTINLDTSTLVVLASDFTHHFHSIPDVAFDYETSRMPHTPKPNKSQPVLRALDNDALRLQADQERRKPLLPLLLEIFAGRKLVATQSAVAKLFTVAFVVAGPRELRRARGLFVDGDLERFGLGVRRNRTGDGENAEHEEAEKGVERVPGVLINIIPDDPSERFRTVFGLPPSDSPSNSSSQRVLIPPKSRPKRFSEHLIAIYGTGDRIRATTVSATAWAEQALADTGIRGLSVWVHESRSFIEQRVKRVREKGLIGNGTGTGPASEGGTEEANDI
ncbi:hypothetical protein HDV00_008169 [Rhizophlyctis rosea]|nr:hypothetical protein HDV00_008169 [Rhizophlyctis rosea]